MTRRLEKGMERGRSGEVTHLRHEARLVVAQQQGAGAGATGATRAADPLHVRVTVGRSAHLQRVTKGRWSGRWYATCHQGTVVGEVVCHVSPRDGGRGAHLQHECDVGVVDAACAYVG